MAFAAPWVLLGLLATLVPVLLHLFARREPPTLDFPAVRYLADTARIHQRRLNLQHLLLLVVRTLLIALLVLAAAGPTWPGRGGLGSHQPGALVVILDNSLSSAATENGVPVFDRLREAAGRVLGSASGQDGVWLLPADGIVRGGTPDELRDVLAGLHAEPRRMDLGAAIARAREVLAGDGRPGEVVVVTDLQSSALSTTPGDGPGSVTVLRPGTDPPANTGVEAVITGPMPWTEPRAEVTVMVTGGRSEAVPVQLTLGTRPPRNGLVPPVGGLTLSVPVAGSGWTPLRIELGADELRMDDSWESAVYLAPPALAVWSPTDRFLAAALEVLADAGRVRAADGSGVAVGALGPGPSVVMPPDDISGIGVFNRALAARGIPWRYGTRTGGTSTDSGAELGSHAVHQRHQLEAQSAPPAGVLVTAGGDPWLVRHEGVVLIGSRLDPRWTDLPLAAEFVPFVDRLVNRLARGANAILVAATGEPVALPDEVDAVLREGERRAVEGGGRYAPASPGVTYLLRGADTVGAVVARPDPRESRLERASDRQVRDLWPEIRLLDLDQAGAAAFAGQAALDLRPWLLWLALVLAATEFGLAGRGGRDGGPGSA